MRKFLITIEDPKWEKYLKKKDVEKMVENLPLLSFYYTVKEIKNGKKNKRSSKRK